MPPKNSKKVLTKQTEKSKKVTDFFSQTKKDSCVINEKESVEEKTVENFYDKCLREKKCQCEKKEASLKIKINALKEKLIEYENMVKIVRSVIEEKDEEINRLRKDVSPDVTTQNTGPVELSQPSFVSFSLHFNPKQLEYLQTINSDERSDSTFVLNVIKFLYDGRHETLETKTACGRKINVNEAKTLMTPQTKLIVERIYSERLNLLQLGALQHDVRRKKINKLIKDAFANITRSNQTKEICRRLQFE